MNVEWSRCAKSNAWWSFDSVALDGLFVYGVFVIWKPGYPPATVCVDKGNIAQRLKSLRQSAAVSSHGADLLVTWTAVPFRLADGIEAYLTDVLRPSVGRRNPIVAPIAVNLPSAALTGRSG
jgi:hypothetical protein